MACVVHMPSFESVPRVERMNHTNRSASARD
jgi:hypothetical protein